MFCTRCGAANGDEWAHCSQCGAPLKKIESPEQVSEPASAAVSAPVEPAAVEPAFVPPVDSSPVAVPPQYGAQIQNPASPSTLPIILAIVFALAVIGVAVAMSFGVFDPEDDFASSAQQEVSTSAQEAAEEDEGAADEDEDAAEEAVESQDEGASESSSATEEETSDSAIEEPPVSRVLDLSNASTYAQVNTFISNFSEVEMGDMPDASRASSEDLATFAVKHVGRNSYSEWELAPSGNPGWGLPRDDEWSGGANGMRSWRLPAERVDELATRYFGRSIDFTEIAFNQHPGWVVYEDGYVYFGTTNGASWPGGVALAKAAYDLPDGTVQIEFDVYNNFGYDATDQSLYSCTPAQIMDRLGVDGPISTGVAIVRQGDYNEYTGGLVLVSYHTSRV